MKKRMITLLLAALVALSASACASPADEADLGSAPVFEASAEPEALPQTSTVDIDIDRFFNMTEAPDIPDVPVATLGEYTVLRSDYLFFYIQLRDNIEYSVGAYDIPDEEKDFFWESEIDTSGTTYRGYLEANALNAAKELAIIYALAVKSGTQPDEMTNQQSDMDVLSLLSQCGSNEGEFARVYQLTSQQLREANHRMNLMIKFMDESMEKFTVSEEETKAVFDAAPEYYDAVTVRHVLISYTDEMTPVERAEAKSLADDVFQQLKEGTDIGELALYYSEDPSSKYQNGEYTFARGEMPKELEDWSFSAAQGDQGLILTEYGYHIVELVAPSGYESAKEEIEYDIRTGMFYQSLAEELELVQSPDWELNQEILDSITVMPQESEESLEAELPEDSHSPEESQEESVSE